MYVETYKEIEWKQIWGGVRPEQEWNSERLEKHFIFALKRKEIEDRREGEIEREHSLERLCRKRTMDDAHVWATSRRMGEMELENCGSVSIPHWEIILVPGLKRRIFKMQFKMADIFAHAKIYIIKRLLTIGAQNCII